MYPWEELLVDYQRYPAQPSQLNPTGDLYALIDLANRTEVGDLKGAAGQSVYLFRKDEAHTFVAGPKATRKAIVAELENTGDGALARELAQKPGDFEYRTIKKGLTVLTIAPDGVNYADATRCGEPGGQCALLRDQPGLTSADIAAGFLDFDEVNQPAVGMTFNDDGRRKFADVTKRIVDSARNEARPANDPDRFWTFAIALDGVVISRPFVDYNQNPNGIDSDQAQSAAAASPRTRRRHSQRP